MPIFPPKVLSDSIVALHKVNQLHVDFHNPRTLTTLTEATRDSPNDWQSELTTSKKRFIRRSACIAIYRGGCVFERSSNQR